MGRTPRVTRIEAHMRPPPSRLTSLAALLFFFLYPTTPAHALRPERGYRATPADYGIICRAVTIQTRDSVALCGWLLPAQDTTGITNDLVGTRIPVPPEMRPPPREYAAPDSAPRPTVV